MLRAAVSKTSGSTSAVQPRLVPKRAVKSVSRSVSFSLAFSFSASVSVKSVDLTDCLLGLVPRYLLPNYGLSVCPSLRNCSLLFNLSFGYDFSSFFFFFSCAFFLSSSGLFFVIVPVPREGCTPMSRRLVTPFPLAVVQLEPTVQVSVRGPIKCSVWVQRWTGRDYDLSGALDF